MFVLRIRKVEVANIRIRVLWQKVEKKGAGPPLCMKINELIWRFVRLNMHKFCLNFLYKVNLHFIQIGSQTLLPLYFFSTPFL